jgi:integrase
MCERAEHEAIKGNLPEYLQDLAELGYLTGWREGEILAFTKAQIDMVAETIRLEPGTAKSGEGRTIAYGKFSELAALIRKQVEKTGALQQARNQIIPWLFHRDGKRIREFRGFWTSAFMKAGIPQRYFHDYRRTAVRNYERARVPRSVAMQLIGHETESIYHCYAITNDDDLAEGMAKRALLENRYTAQASSV